MSTKILDAIKKGIVPIQHRPDQEGYKEIEKALEEALEENHLSSLLENKDVLKKVTDKLKTATEGKLKTETVRKEIDDVVAMLSDEKAVTEFLTEGLTGEALKDAKKAIGEISYFGQRAAGYQEERIEIEMEEQAYNALKNARSEEDIEKALENVEKAIESAEKKAEKASEWAEHFGKNPDTTEAAKKLERLGDAKAKVENFAEKVADAINGADEGKEAEAASEALSSWNEFIQDAKKELEKTAKDLSSDGAELQKIKGAVKKGLKEMKITGFDLKKTVEPEKKVLEDLGKSFTEVTKGAPEAAKNGRKMSAFFLKDEKGLEAAKAFNKDGKVVKSLGEAISSGKLGSSLHLGKTGLAVAGAVALGAALRPKDKGYDAIQSQMANGQGRA